MSTFCSLSEPGLARTLPFAFQNSSSTNALLPQQALSCPWILMMDKRKYSASDGVGCVSVWVLFRVPLSVFSNKCSCCVYIESGVLGVSTFARSNWLTKDTQITLDSSWTDTYTQCGNTLPNSLQHRVSGRGLLTCILRLALTFLQCRSWAVTCPALLQVELPNTLCTGSVSRGLTAQSPAPLILSPTHGVRGTLHTLFSHSHVASGYLLNN